MNHCSLKYFSLPAEIFFSFKHFFTVPKTKQVSLVNIKGHDFFEYLIQCLEKTKMAIIVYESKLVCFKCLLPRITNFVSIQV